MYAQACLSNHLKLRQRALGRRTAQIEFRSSGSVRTYSTI